MTEAPESYQAKMSRRYSTMVVAALSIIVLACLAFLIPVPYVTMRPGQPFDTLGQIDGKPMFAFEKNVKTYPTSGKLDFTTVSVTSPDAHISLFKAVGAYVNKDNAVVPKSLVYPEDQTPTDSKAESAAQMAGSKQTSEAAALRAAGYKVSSVTAVQSVLKGGAAGGKLVAGDVIEEVDGVKAVEPADVSGSIGKRKPGEGVTLTVTRDGKRKTVDLVTKADVKDKTQARIGIILGEKFVFPIKIINNVRSDIGGPSAGAMFALAIYDKLTPGALTGGKNVAGTGEIAGDGTVGSIGGIRQKMAGAAAFGTEIFLVPAPNCDEAISGDDFGMTLVKVAKLEDAITALEKLGKDPKAKVSACS